MEFDFDADGSGVGAVTLFAFFEGVFGFAEGEIFEEKFEIAAKVRNGRDILENFAETFLFEPVVRVTLKIQQVRHLHNFLDASETVPCSFADLNRIKH